MKLKWYICTLIIVLTFLGVGQHQISVPNQEIIVQFTDDEVSSDDAQNAIAIVKNQLQTVGVDNIQVHEVSAGRLKITYYSDIDVASIKDVLSQENGLKLGSVFDDESSKIPSDDDSNTYNLDVYEIQKPSDSEWDFEGTLVLELKPEGDRFSNPKVFASINKIDVEASSTKIACKVHYNIAIAIDNTSYKIPEVRAGPIA